MMVAGQCIDIFTGEKSHDSIIEFQTIGLFFSDHPLDAHHRL